MTLLGACRIFSGDRPSGNPDVPGKAAGLPEGLQERNPAVLSVLRDAKAAQSSLFAVQHRDLVVSVLGKARNQPVTKGREFERREGVGGGGDGDGGGCIHVMPAGFGLAMAVVSAQQNTCIWLHSLSSPACICQ